MTRNRPWLRWTVIVLTVYMGVSIVLGTIAYKRDEDQQNELRSDATVTLGTICGAARVIAHAPQEKPARGEGESRAEFTVRARVYANFVASARALCHDAMKRGLIGGT